MPRNSADKRAMRLLGASVLAVFLFGVTSGPVRTCLSHPGHGAEQHEGTLVPQHMASHHAMPSEDEAPPPVHEGCSCLGQCSLEYAPHAPASAGPALAYAPTLPRTLHPANPAAPQASDEFRIPFARPPPAVV